MRSWGPEPHRHSAGKPASNEASGLCRAFGAPFASPVPSPAASLAPKARGHLGGPAGQQCFCPVAWGRLTGSQFCVSGLVPAAVTQARLPGPQGPRLLEPSAVEARPRTGQLSRLCAPLCTCLQGGLGSGGGKTRSRYSPDAPAGALSILGCPCSSIRREATKGPARRECQLGLRGRLLLQREPTTPAWGIAGDPPGATK